MMTTTPSQHSPESIAAATPINAPTSPPPYVARAATYYRVTRYIMVLAMFVYGLMSIYDGFYRYPKDNEEDRAAGHDVMRHGPLDIPFNCVVGAVLPPLAIAMLIHALRKSRGEIRFDGTTLHAPGHPPVPLEAITALDQRQWDRKGIAHIDYELPTDQRKGRITLDDFIYQREPIDAIYDSLVAFLTPPTATPIEQ